MTYLQYANYIASGTEFLAIAAALIFKSYRTNFGLIIFLMPLSSCIADSLYLYSNFPKYIPFGMFYGIFDLFNTLAFFIIIDVFTKNEIKVISLIKIISAIIIITSIVEILQTKTRYHDITSGISNLFDGFLGLIAAFRLLQRTAKEKKDVRTRAGKAAKEKAKSEAAKEKADTGFEPELPKGSVIPLSEALKSKP